MNDWRKGKKFELFSCNRMIFRPANSEEGSGEDGDRGEINQLSGFHLQSSWFINTQASSQITRIVTETNIETESLGQEVVRIWTDCSFVYVMDFNLCTYIVEFGSYIEMKICTPLVKSFVWYSTFSKPNRSKAKTKTETRRSRNAFKEKNLDGY